MNVIYLLLYIASAACFGIAAFTGNPTLGARGGARGGNINLVAAGLFLFVLVFVLVQLQTVDD